jgi:hypothetical protein
MADNEYRGPIASRDTHINGGKGVIPGKVSIPVTKPGSLNTGVARAPLSSPTSAKPKRD